MNIPHHDTNIGLMNSNSSLDRGDNPRLLIVPSRLGHITLGRAYSFYYVFVIQAMRLNSLPKHILPAKSSNSPFEELDCSGPWSTLTRQEIAWKSDSLVSVAGHHVPPNSQGTIFLCFGCLDHVYFRQKEACVITSRIFFNRNLELWGHDLLELALPKNSHRIITWFSDAAQRLQQML